MAHRSLVSPSLLLAWERYRHSPDATLNLACNWREIDDRGGRRCSGNGGILRLLRGRRVGGPRFVESWSKGSRCSFPRLGELRQEIWRGPPANHPAPTEIYTLSLHVAE